MKLKLKDFRQHKSLSLDFPDKGFVLLKGVSGAGKSTILDAIKEVLKGDADDVKPWDGGTSPLVELSAWMPLGLDIARKRTPNSLKVSFNGEVFTDDAAEALITSTLGMNTQELDASSYIKQGAAECLINLPPAEQLRFIQRLAFGDQDPEAIRKKIDVYGVAKEKAWSLANALKIQLEEDVETANLLLKASSYSTVFFDSVALELTSKEHAKRQAVLRTLTDKYHQVLKELSSGSYAEAAALQAEVANIANQIKELTKNREIKQAELNGLEMPFSGMSKADAEVKQRILAAYGPYLTARKQAKDLMKEVEAMGYPGEGKLASFLESMAVGTKEIVLRIKARVAALQINLKDKITEAQAQECPECKAPLKVVAGKVVVHSHSQESLVALTREIEALKSELAEDEQQYDTMSKSLANIERLHLEAVKIKKTLDANKPILGIDTNEDLSKEIGNIYEYLKFNAVLENMRQALDLSIRENSEAIKQLEFDTSKAIKRLHVLESNQTSKEILERQAQDLTDNISKSQDVLDNIEKNLISLKESEKLFNESLAKKAVAEERQKQLQLLENKLEEASKSLDVAAKDIGIAEKLKEISDYAAVEAIEGIIEAINQNAAHHISDMFPDTGTTVRILNVSKTQKGEERAKLSLSIIHKGCEVGKKLKSLSGGEKDRIVLAFQAGLSDLYNSPILLIDEGFTGVDIEKTLGPCLEKLKEMAYNKLIIMVQHGVPEHYFDQVIEITA